MALLTRRRLLTMAGLAGLAGTVGAYSVFVERYAVQTNRYRIPVPNLPPAFEGFRIVHLTDIHHGALMPIEWIRSLVARANRIPRDITVCTGDFVHARNTTQEIDAVWPVVVGLNAPGGVYSVLGNHDHWADTERSLHWLKASGQDLRRRAVRLERGGSSLWLAGAGDLWEDHAPLDQVLSSVPDSGCRIVLAHNPDTADTPFASRVDLMISGHTHGGQVNVPFLGPPILPVENKNYSCGFKRSLRGAGVFISRGIGWAIYPVRFNCFPEIAVLELVRG
jgi:hypothetical protein